jgi:hypothetical protein
MRIDVSLVPLKAVLATAAEFPAASFVFSANAVCEQVVLELF